jgi:phenylacetic acid degradation operon negative regulatory protein
VTTAIPAAPTTRERQGGHADLARGSARSVLLTILGELVWPTGRPAQTSSLLYVMNGLGIEESAARQAIVRGADSGWIEAHRHGREVSWSVTPHLSGIFDEGSQRLLSLSDPIVDWDGTWLTLFVTVPQALRASRKRLYRGLEWAGFGNPAAGVWITPHPERRAQAGALIDKLGLTESTLAFAGQADRVAKGWDLETLADDYAEVESHLVGPGPDEVDGVLFAHVRALDEIQRFPFSDPQLPEALLPGWIGRRVSKTVQSLREGWADEVGERWSEIDGRTD